MQSINPGNNPKHREKMNTKTLYDLLEDYLERLESLNYSPRTGQASQYICLEFIRYLQEKSILEAAKIKKIDLINWQKHLSKQTNRKGLPIKARTMNFKITGVKNFLRYLVLTGYLMESTINVVRSVKEPQMLPLGVFTHTELKKIIRKVDASTPAGYRDRTILEFLYSTAVRASELTALNIRSIDFENRTAVIFGKGRKERVVPVGKTALKCLETYIRGVRPYILNGTECDALFVSKLKKRLGYAGLLKIIHKYANLTNIDENVTPHMFRRSCTTELIRNGANLYHIKDMLGHESLETLKHYTKLTITDLKKTHKKCHPREREK